LHILPHVRPGARHNVRNKTSKTGEIQASPGYKPLSGIAIDRIVASCSLK
jgi:hypothetical protein